MMWTMVFDYSFMAENTAHLTLGWTAGKDCKLLISALTGKTDNIGINCAAYIGIERKEKNFGQLILALTAMKKTVGN